jgi:uncharacterized integral membrane protein
MMQWLRRLTIIAALLCVAVIAVIAVNQEPVRLRFLVWESPEWSLFWWLLAAFVLGGVFGHLLALFSTLPLRFENRRLQKALQASARPVVSPDPPAAA